ncbi:MauE/DoxX family redox-associated membrane protein [Spirillospora sp. NPDC048911]|uniref:MauE/DoxX family redox-associated membrane protein n=1 Tax=Spirillospora sp. NPDC048911 TaxID=3364527 RepID=UPI003721914F
MIGCAVAGLAAAAYPALIGVLLVAMAGKVRDVRKFAATIGGYRIMPGRLTMSAAVAVLATELIAAGLLAAPGTRRWGALLATALFAAFLGAMVSVLRRGLRVDCGCFGSVRRSNPVSRRTVARTSLFLILAVTTMAAPPATFSVVHLVLSALDLCLLGAFYLCLLAVVARLRGRPVPPESPPPAGPRPGARFTVTAAPLRRAGDTRPTLYALISPDCGTCTAMLPAFSAAAPATRVVLVSAAGERPVREHLAAHGVADLPLAIDPDVYEANDIAWPPFVVITDVEGTVLAAGGADTPQRLDSLLRRVTSYRGRVFPGAPA